MKHCSTNVNDHKTFGPFPFAATRWERWQNCDYSQHEPACHIWPRPNKPTPIIFPGIKLLGRRIMPGRGRRGQRNSWDFDVLYILLLIFPKTCKLCRCMGTVMMMMMNDGDKTGFVRSPAIKLRNDQDGERERERAIRCPRFDRVICAYFSTWA